LKLDITKNKNKKVPIHNKNKSNFIKSLRRVKIIARFKSRKRRLRHKFKKFNLVIFKSGAMKLMKEYYQAKSIKKHYSQLVKRLELIEQ
jgi:hypothetical protein